jgi:hypothetical protein
MGIKANFKGSMDNVLRTFLAEVERQIIESLCRIGEEAVAFVRKPHARDWEDQTGNLRSSIGYVVFKDGRQIRQSTFETVPPKEKRENVKYNGASEGLALAQEVGSTHKEGYTLVVVAGMNYAVHVESKGRDVLTSAEKQAEKQIARELADMVTNITNAFR